MKAAESSARLAHYFRFQFDDGDDGCGAGANTVHIHWIISGTAAELPVLGTFQQSSKLGKMVE
jgi:hypothetical protein